MSEAEARSVAQRRGLPSVSPPGCPARWPAAAHLWAHAGALGLGSLLAVTTYGWCAPTCSPSTTGQRSSRRTSTPGANELMQSETSLRITMGMQAAGVRFRRASQQPISFNSAALNENTIPEVLKQRVINEQRDARMITTVNGQRVIVVGVNLVDNAYFESFGLGEASATLNNVALSLALAATISTMLGVLIGGLAARRAVRPVAAASEAATSLAGGHLHTPRATTEDPDLGVLAQSFNDMAETLQQRLERARFASDVSRAALAADDPVGVGRGDGVAARGDAGACPGGTRPARQ